MSFLADFGIFKPIPGSKNLSSSSHVLYADDVLVFCKGTKRGHDALTELLHDYSQATRQHLSLNKSRFYASRISTNKITQIAGVLGFVAGSLPFNYLKVPLVKGKPRRIHLHPIVDKILGKLAS